MQFRLGMISSCGKQQYEQAVEGSFYGSAALPGRLGRTGDYTGIKYKSGYCKLQSFCDASWGEPKQREVHIRMYIDRDRRTNSVPSSLQKGATHLKVRVALMAPVYCLLC